MPPLRWNVYSCICLSCKENSIRNPARLPCIFQVSNTVYLTNIITVLLKYIILYYKHLKHTHRIHNILRWSVKLQTRYMWLTPCCRVLLEYLTVPQLVKKFSAFCEKRMFIAAFTTAPHWSLTRTTPIQYISPLLFLKD